MGIAPGSRLGPYEILAPLGAGGMGEVFRARDTRLGRDVAIKLVHGSFAADPERLARLRREAKVLAALNHPNIAAVYGLEASADGDALVMELVRGETLADRLARGPIPVEEALGIARQIALGLEAAHERGVIHRDLKPSNVQITPEGTVKLLDFGLAKVLEGERSDPGSISRSPTISDQMTGTGVILGSAAYMSPEQARGRPLDRRSDVWAFGVVLYEMLVGKRAFEAETVSDTLAAVLTREPDWSALPPDTPPAVRRVLEKCLARDSARRIHDVADARLDLDDPREGEVASIPATGRRRSRALGVAAALLAVAAAVGWILALRKSSATPSRISRFVIPLPASDRMPFDDLPVFDLSRDGAKLVYVADRGAGRRLFLRSLDRTESTPISGTEGALGPFFSPDARSIGFFADRKLKRVAIEGGIPTVLADASDGRGAVWLPDDTIVFATTYTSGLQRVTASGGPPEVLTTPDPKKGERTHRWPALLPDGSILFTVGSLAKPDNFDDASLARLDPKTRAIRTILPSASMGLYANRHLVCVRAGSLAAVPFDPDRSEVRGQPASLAERIDGDRSSGIAFFAIDDSGTLVFLPPAGSHTDRTLVLTDRKGTPAPFPAPPRSYYYPRFSPDGKRIAVSIGSGRNHDDDIWIGDVAEAALTRLTFGNLGANPVWSPDGRRLAFSTPRDRQTMYARNADGSGTEESLEPERIEQKAVQAAME